MPKPARQHFFCSACGHEAARWFGRCPGCGAWNTAAEAPVQKSEGRGNTRAARARWSPGGATAPPAPRPLASVEIGDLHRAGTGLGELDRVLGGGIVRGSLILVGGDPGIGKSTLLLQLAMRLARDGRRVLYVSGEESEEQVRMRAARLGETPEGLLILCETDLEALLEAAAGVAPEAMVVDSIQTLARADLEGGPGTVTQVRECALALLHYAKGSGAAVFLVGHVTKDGAVAGPRVLEHMVDAVLYLEGERYQHYRVLRAAKNRFGSTHELGVFEMTDAGLVEVANPSRAFLSESARTEPGSAVVASLEGTRPLLVEVQALVSPSYYGTPQRVTSGFDPRRLAVLLAVLERRVGLRLGRHDVFVTVTGGLTLDEPGTDLGVALAAASSFRSRPVREGTLAVGEVSLSGELRRVARLEARVREAAQLGFARAGVPAAQVAEAEGHGLEIVPLTTLREAIDLLLGERAPGRPAAAGAAEPSAVPVAGSGPGR
ncbi:MAG: DNA repair protein RadA [Candidatus Eisenbacteria bacterium RBG_16_71_46]|nr:MAG: DNA repair protein RadA [Candidatus Eisenbacteria bacterium RBG_16_71_46]